VVDGGNFRVVVFDRDGKYLQSFGSVGRQLGAVLRAPRRSPPIRRATSTCRHGVRQLPDLPMPMANCLCSSATRDERDAPSATCCPSGIAVDEDGRVYVVDQVVPQDRRVPAGRAQAQRRLSRPTPGPDTQVDVPNSDGSFLFAENKTFPLAGSRFLCVGNSDAKAPSEGQIPTIGNGTPFALVLRNAHDRAFTREGEGP